MQIFVFIGHPMAEIRGGRDRGGDLPGPPPPSVSEVLKTAQYSKG